MKADGLPKRLLTLAVIAVAVLAVFFVGVTAVYSYRGAQCRECVEDFDRAYRDLFLCGTSDRDDTQVSEIVERASGYLTDGASKRYADGYSDIVWEVSNEVRTVTKFSRIVTDTKTDYRYGGITVTVYSTVDYSGSGVYIGRENEDISYIGKCTQTYRMEKTDDGYKISEMKTEYES